MNRLHMTWVITVTTIPGSIIMMAKNTPLGPWIFFTTNTAPVITLAQARPFISVWLCQGERMIKIAQTGHNTKG